MWRTDSDRFDYCAVGGNQLSVPIYYNIVIMEIVKWL